MQKHKKEFTPRNLLMMNVPQGTAYLGEDYGTETLTEYYVLVEYEDDFGGGFGECRVYNTEYIKLLQDCPIEELTITDGHTKMYFLDRNVEKIFTARGETFSPYRCECDQYDIPTCTEDSLEAIIEGFKQLGYSYTYDDISQPKASYVMHIFTKAVDVQTTSVISITVDYTDSQKVVGIAEIVNIDNKSRRTRKALTCEETELANRLAEYFNIREMTFIKT